MIRFLLRRIVHATTLLLVTLTVTFLIIHLAPGDPTNLYYSPDVDPRALDTVRRQLGLDDPLPVQYVKTLFSFVRGEFGVSIHSRRQVSDVLRETIPRTLLLTTIALALQIIFGLAIGIVSAMRKHRAADNILSFLALLFYSVPAFLLAFIFILFFSLKLGWLPASSMTTIGAEPAGAFALLIDRLLHLIMPVAVLALGSAAYLGRYTRGRLVDVLREDFIRTARAKGLSEKHVATRHAFKNALPQVLTVIGLSVPVLLTGAVVVEKVFAWPGMGTLIVDSIFARDYPMILATNFIAAAMVILGNLLADVSHVWFDPRARQSLESGAR